MEQGGGRPRPEPFSFGEVWEFLKRHKVIVAGVLTPVVATELTNVVGPVVRWAVRGALLLLVCGMVAILYIRRRGMWTRSRKRMSELAERFRPEEGNAEEPPEDVGAETATPPRRRRWKVVAGVAAVLSVAGVVAAAALISGDGYRQEETPEAVPAASALPSQTAPPTASPDAPASYVGEPIVGVMRDLRTRGVSVDVEIRVDPEERAGTIVEQDPDPLPSESKSVEFAITGRRRSTPLDGAFVVAGGGSWREGAQSIFGTPSEHAFFLRDGGCFDDSYYCDFNRRSPVLALNLSRDFEIFSATLGFDDRSRVTDASIVEVILHGLGAEEGKTVCRAQVRPASPLRLRLDVSGQSRLEIVFRPWRERQIPAVGEPTGVFVDSTLLSPPVTRYENLLPTPPPNGRCFG
jgi:hypothetical protein